MANATSPGSLGCHQRAMAVMPGGVNSPVRAFRGVGGTPRFFTAGHGPWLVDVDGNELLDYVMSWGPLILGHAEPRVTEQVIEAVRRGSSFGASTPRESELAEAIIAAVPSVEVVRLVNSGTEAGMSALRLARGFTGRDRIVKFDGCYHGHSDSLLVAAGSGVATFGLPDSPGVPGALAELTHSLPYGELEPVEATLRRFKGEVAAIIVEPVAGNMGVVDPPREFLQGLRELCDEHGALLIFDEVMSGFRVALGGAQERVGLRPDLTMMGKVIGGGFPLAAYGGREDILRRIAPDGPVYQAGTLSGNPVAVTAGLATLTILGEAPPYEQLEAISARLEQGVREQFAASDEPVTINRVGAMMTVFFSPGPIRNYAEAKQADADKFAAFFHAALGQGLYLPPSQFEAWFPSAAHDTAAVEQTIAKVGEALRACRQQGWQRPE